MLTTKVTYLRSLLFRQQGGLIVYLEEFIWHN